MIDHWEWLAVGFFLGVFVVYGISYVVLLYQTSPWRHMQRDAIYGPADLGRTNGPQAKPNLRVVS